MQPLSYRGAWETKHQEAGAAGTTPLPPLCPLLARVEWSNRDWTYPPTRND